MEQGKVPSRPMIWETLNKQLVLPKNLLLAFGTNGGQQIKSRSLYYFEEKT